LESGNVRRGGDLAAVDHHRTKNTEKVTWVIVPLKKAHESVYSSLEEHEMMVNPVVLMECGLPS
jgi:hypothetical protein